MHFNLHILCHIATGVDVAWILQRLYPNLDAQKIMLFAIAMYAR